jgi:hypothetical protein
MNAYTELTQLMPTLHGWCSLEKAITLYNIVRAVRPNIVVEIGVWGGRSFFPMAMALKENHQGTIIGIDPWSTEASAEGQTTNSDHQWWQEVANHELVYQHFMHQLDKLGLNGVSEIHRAKSEKIDLPMGIGLLHLDGNHGPQAYDETVRLAPRVIQHGFVVLDDLTWSGGHVQRAADWMKENGFLELHHLGTGAVYLKT